MAPPDHLAVEWRALRQSQFSPTVIHTIQASRRQSTTRIYNATWKAFGTWCSRLQVEPSKALVTQVLDFLQDGLDRGLTPSTIKHEVVALLLVLSTGKSESLSKHPMVSRFLKGTTNLRPPVIHRYPTWDVSQVLQAVMGGPFEPL